MCPQRFRGGQKVERCEAPDVPNRKKSVLVTAMKIRGVCCNQQQRHRGERRDVRKQIPWRQLRERELIISLYSADYRLIMAWIQAPATSLLCCTTWPQSAERRGGSRCLLSIKKLPCSSEADNIYRQRLKALICIKIYIPNRSKHEKEK